MAAAIVGLTEKALPDLGAVAKTLGEAGYSGDAPPQPFAHWAATPPVLDPTPNGCPVPCTSCIRQRAQLLAQSSSPDIRLVATRLVALIGLGFGDCGKGLFTDFLTRHWNAPTVVRFNGNAPDQAQRFLPMDATTRFRSSAQAPWCRGCAQCWPPVVVHPGALLIRHAALQRLGVHDYVWGRLLIDARCRINTPFSPGWRTAAQWARGSHAHGSCGVGVGETVRHGLQHPTRSLRYGDLVTSARWHTSRTHPAHAAGRVWGLAPQLPAALYRPNGPCWPIPTSNSVGWRNAGPLIAACPPAAPHAIAGATIDRALSC